MQQIENSTQNKKASKFENFFIYYPIWLGIESGNQTFGDELDFDVGEIEHLLAI